MTIVFAKRGNERAMARSKPIWKMDADPRRQATDALRGYVYQVWQALHAWLELQDDQVLYLEGAEDFDVIDEDSGMPVQVKDTFGNITLRTQSVTDAISHFWQLRNMHRDKAIEFHFITRSSVGVEQGTPFGRGKGGLALWQECHGDHDVVRKLATFLCEDSVLAQRLPSDLVGFLRTAEPRDAYDYLISPVKWFTGAPPVEAVTQAVERKLVTYGDRFDVHPSDCIKVADRLLREVLTVASQKKYEDRQLDFAQFALIFEEATSVRVPRRHLREIQALQQISFGAVARPPASPVVSFQPAGPALAPGSPPPLPPGVAPRQKLVEQCRASLLRQGQLFITASTGMGKSTLAKLTALALGDDWAWFTLSAFHGERYAWALAQTARLIDDLPRGTHIVLDDLALDPGDVPEWEQILAGLVYTAKARQVLVIATSRKPVPARLCNALGLSASSEFIVPDFDEAEIRKLCVQLGCQDGKQAGIHAEVAYLHTSGHPQLIHARLLTLSRQGWPRLSTDSLLATPEDVREQQEQARQLLHALATDERDLLYRASVALAPFRREHIVILGEKANLSHPGDVLDRLVGPWIERSTEGRFELSPLLRNAAREVWSQEIIEGIHSEMADAILMGKELSITDGSHALLHAFIGKNRQALTGLAISLTTQASEEVQKAIAENAFWLLGTQVDDKSGLLFEPDPHLSLLLRMLQFRLCAVAEPDRAPRILEAWEREVSRFDDSPENLCSRMLFYTSGLLYVQVPLPFRRVLRLFKELASVRQAMMAPECQELFGPIPLTEIDKDGRPVNLLATLFGVNGMRCKTKEDLDELLNGLTKLGGELRQELLGAFNMPEGYASAYVNSAYLGEGKAETPDWQTCLAVLSKTMGCATDWGSPSLGAAAARAASIVLDEHLNQPDEALAILDDGAERFPSHVWLIEEHRGTVLLHAKRYKEAVTVFTHALEGREDGHLEVLHAPFFSFRNAGIAAARAKRWDVAADFFHRGHRCAMALDDRVFAVAFQADAAYAFWEAGRPQEMLASLRSSIELVDAMERSKTDPGPFWVFRVTAHTLSWIRSVVEDGQPLPELATPLPGMCSNPERNEEILTLPDVPFELTLYFLIRLEKALQSEPLALARYGAKLDGMSLPAIAVFMSLLRIEEAFSSGSFNGLPALVDKQVRGYLASRKLVSDGKQPWAAAEEQVPEEQVRKALLEEDFLEGLFLAALLRACHSGTHDVCAKCVQEWRASAVAVSWHNDLTEYLNRAEALHRLSANELRKTLHDSEAPTRDRQLASLFLAHGQSGVGLRDLLQAHVFLLDRFSQSCIWGKYIEEALSTIIASAWAQRAKARFALCTPQITGPALEAACSLPKESFGKAAAVLLAAADATGVKIPQALVDRYRQLRDGISKGTQR